MEKGFSDGLSFAACIEYSSFDEASWNAINDAIKNLEIPDTFGGNKSKAIEWLCDSIIFLNSKYLEVDMDNDYALHSFYIEVKYDDNTSRYYEIVILETYGEYDIDSVWRVDLVPEKRIVYTYKRRVQTC